MPHPPLSPSKERELFRKKVAEQARQGGRPRDRFHADDLVDAYLGREQELAELDELAQRVRADELERNRRLAERQALRSETDAILRQWDAEAAAERRAKAETEARRRLGMEDA